MNRKIKFKLDQVRRDMPEVVGNRIRPSLPTVIERFEHALATDPVFKRDVKPGEIHRLPQHLDLN